MEGIVAGCFEGLAQHTQMMPLEIRAAIFAVAASSCFVNLPKYSLGSEDMEVISLNAVECVKRYEDLFFDISNGISPQLVERIADCYAKTKGRSGEELGPSCGVVDGKPTVVVTAPCPRVKPKAKLDTSWTDPITGETGLTKSQYMRRKRSRVRQRQRQLNGNSNSKKKFSKKGKEPFEDYQSREIGELESLLLNEEVFEDIIEQPVEEVEEEDLFEECESHIVNDSIEETDLFVEADEGVYSIDLIEEYGSTTSETGFEEEVLTVLNEEGSVWGNSNLLHLSQICAASCFQYIARVLINLKLTGSELRRRYHLRREIRCNKVPKLRYLPSQMSRIALMLQHQRDYRAGLMPVPRDAVQAQAVHPGILKELYCVGVDLMEIWQEEISNLDEAN